MGSRGARLSKGPGVSVEARSRTHVEFEFEAETLKGESFRIGRTLSARAKNYDIEDSQSGKVYHFLEGTEISSVEVFAGKGVRKKLRPEVVAGLRRQYGGRSKDWQHVKGVGTIDLGDRSKTAEVHWFQEPTVGKIKFKIKRWL